MALLSDQVREAQELLSRVERECSKRWLYHNAKKTEYMAFKIEEYVALKTNGRPSPKRVVDCKYLSSRMESTKKDIKIWKALAWKALHDIKTFGGDITENVEAEILPCSN